MWKKIGGVLLVLIILGIIFGDGEGDSTASSSNLASASKAPDFNVSCSSISKEVDANEARASAKYSDKVIKISGRVQSVSEDMWGDNVVNLSDGEEYSFNSCILNDVPQNIAISLDKGQSVTFTCDDFMEVIGSTSLSNCSIN